MGISKISSDGISKYSGSWPSADKTKGRMSNFVILPFHPNLVQTCDFKAIDVIAIYEIFGVVK